MKQQYTVFYDRRKIEFLHVSNKPVDGSKCSHIYHIDWNVFITFIHGSEICLQCFSVNPESAFRKFATFFVHHEAAGGLVRNNNGEYLFIFRNGRWDLPKGYVDPGETLMDAALREVGEECGLTYLSIVRSLQATYHVFPLDDDQWALKRTHWFVMQAGKDERIVPQASEGITHAEWRQKNDMDDIKMMTYGNICQLIEQVLEL